ncbi:MAG: hypothetical protein Q9221_002077 [Calogaya cf. arnoldii]
MSARSFASRRFFSQQSTGAPTRWKKPYIVTYATIGTCCSAYAYNLYADDQARERRFWHRNFIDKHLIFTRDNYNAGRWWTMVTYSFMHTSALHLAVNMLAFSSFSPICISTMGLRSFAALWLGGSVSAMYLTMLGDDYKKKQASSGSSRLITSIGGRPLPQRAQGNPENTRHIGASASLLSLVTAVACRTPWHGVYVIPIPVSIPMYGAVGGFAVFSIIAFAQDLVPFIGHAGHLGGMAFGAAYYALALRTKRFPKR